jgi:hypothetical protein
MPTTLRRIALAAIALASLTVAFYVTGAGTATVPQDAAPGVAGLPIGILDLTTGAKGLPEQRYDAF